MFPLSAESSQIVKVSLGDETRRLTVSFGAGAFSVAAFDDIEKAVRQSFSLSETDGLVLKYLDDEGDLCTFVEGSVDDLASLAKGKPWKLQASLVTQPAATVVAQTPDYSIDLTEGSDACPAAEAAGSPVKKICRGSEGGSSSTGTDLSDDSDDRMPPEWQDISAAMAHRMLPFVSMAAQMDDVRSVLNATGVEQRERIVAWCCEVSEHLDLVPEAASLRPKLEGFIGGGDSEHFGAVLAELLQAWASSSSPELVEIAVDMHHTGLSSIIKQTFKALRTSKGNRKGKGMGKGHWWMGKGGKDKGDCEGRVSKGDWWKGKGEWWEAKARGKGAFKGALAGLLAQNGVGEGMGFCPGWPPSVVPTAGPAATQESGATTTSPMDCSAIPATAAAPMDCSATADSAVPQDAVPEDGDLSSKVQQLLDMGLVTDPGVCLDLLREHGGDATQVAAMLIG